MNKIPINNIINQLDTLFSKNDMEGAGALLEKWEKMARTLEDKEGEITVQSEMMGYYRKVQNREKGLASVHRGISLVRELSLENTVPGATVILNGATTMKAFGKATEAMPLYEEVLKVYTENLNEKDPRIAGLCNNMALALVDTGDFERAKKLYEEALSVLSGTVEGLLDSAVTYVNMAHMHEASTSIESKKNIKSCMDAALLCLCDQRLSENGYMAYVYAKCAPSFAHFGDSDTAAFLMKSSEEIYEKYRKETK